LKFLRRRTGQETVVEKRDADITGQRGMALTTRMTIEEGKSTDRGGTERRMMAGVRNIAHGGQRTTTREATNIAHVSQRTKKAVEAITTGPSAMLPPMKTITAGAKTIDRDGIVRKRSQTVHDVTAHDQTSVVVTTKSAIRVVSPVEIHI
jgi:hypothetical protein